MNVTDEKGNRMPVLFVGHGSPMNAIADNPFTRKWTELAGQIPRPDAILAVSAHWYTNGTRVSDAEQPRTIYDMYGFPEELYRLKYKPKGAPEIAQLARELIGDHVLVDNTWGIDHGTWSVLCRMYPEADVPVFQLSIDRNVDAREQFMIGKSLRALREKKVLIIGSGNVVHNLTRLGWEMDGGYPWAEEFDQYILEKIEKREFEGVIEYKRAGKPASMAFITPEHFYPLLAILGAVKEEDQLTIFNQSCIFGSLSMTSYLFG